jgi:hypothetical protein
MDKLLAALLTVLQPLDTLFIIVKTSLTVRVRVMIHCLPELVINPAQTRIMTVILTVAAFPAIFAVLSRWTQAAAGLFPK